VDKVNGIEGVCWQLVGVVCMGLVLRVWPLLMMFMVKGDCFMIMIISLRLKGAYCI
jgi:hypothetical protein